MNGGRKQELKGLRGNSLETLFYPDSIAMIGASQNPIKPNGIPLLLLSEFGYRGEVYPVNPKYDRVGGLKCYPSILDIEAPVDLAIVGVPAGAALGVLRQCARKQVKAAVVFTSGFAESGSPGRLVQQEMKSLAEQSGMRILGPNCLGILNYYNGSMASFFYNQERHDLAHPETLSFVTQSGGLGGIIFQMMVQLSIGFNYFVSTGNEADVSFAEVLDYLTKRDEVSIVAGYLEGLQGDGGLFIEACRRAFEKGKLVTLLKAGRTFPGAAAAASHTGALVGADSVYDGLFKQLGVVRADDVEQLNALVTLYTAGRLPAGKRIAVITISGGGGVIVADKCPEYGLEVIKLSAETREELRRFFPDYGAVANPVDLTSKIFFDPELFQRTLRVVMQDPDIDVGGFFYNFEMPDREAGKKIIEVYRETEKPLIIFAWPTGQDYAVEARRELIRAGIPVIEHIPSGLWAVSALVDWAAGAGKETGLTVSRPGVSAKKAAALAGELQAAGGAVLTEWRAKKILGAYGIPVTKEILAADPGEAVRAAEIIGYPVAMKIMSPQLMHKTEAGGVILNVGDRHGVEQGYAEIVERARQHRPGAVIEGVLVQEMLKPGLEVIAGLKKDPVFGPVVLLGLGGVFVEVFRDTATRVAPLQDKDARSMIEELKGGNLFKEVRGRKAGDIDALVDTLLRLSRLAVEQEEWIREMDINPLIIYGEGEGVVAADALIVL